MSNNPSKHGVGLLEIVGVILFWREILALILIGAVILGPPLVGALIGGMLALRSWATPTAPTIRYSPHS